MTLALTCLWLIFVLVFFIIHLSLKLNLNKMYGKKLYMYKLFTRMNKEVCKAKTFISISAQKNCCLLSQGDDILVRMCDLENINKI